MANEANHTSNGGHDIVVIGGSAGSIEALKVVLGALPAGLPAAIFVVIHISPDSPNMLPDILSSVSALPLRQPKDGEPIELGQVYLAWPDRHLLVQDGRARVVRGPKENRHRPAVDPLFRSAAQSYGPRVIGVVVTGALDDGTAGLAAIKRRGGVALVQEPSTALYPGMPASAVGHVDVDEVLSLEEIGPAIARLASEPEEAGSEEALAPGEPAVPVPEEPGQENASMAPATGQAPRVSAAKPEGLEVAFAEMQDVPVEELSAIGRPSVFSCPECSGVLWEVDEGRLTRFRCRTGHAYSIESLATGHAAALEAALWAALRALEEAGSLARRLSARSRKQGATLSAGNFEDRAVQHEHHADVIRSILGQSTTLATDFEGPSAGARPQ